MAGISGNFNFPSDKGFGTRGKVSQPGEKAPEVAGDSVQLHGTGMVARNADHLAEGLRLAQEQTDKKIDRIGFDECLRASTETAKELLQSTSDHGVINPQAAVNRSPMTLSMDEAHGISALGDMNKADNGHGLTGLNSISSVVSSGRFEGLNASYGEKRLFSL